MCSNCLLFYKGEKWFSQEKRRRMRKVENQAEILIPNCDELGLETVFLSHYTMEGIKYYK